MIGLRALLFDLDGTLIDNEELHRRAYNLTFLKFGLDWSWSPTLYAKLLKTSGGVDRIAAYIDDLNRAPAEADRLRRLVPGIHRAKTRLYGELLCDSANRLRSGVVRLFGAARENSLKLGIAATSDLSNVQTLLAAAFGNEVRQAIGSVVGAEMVERKKPAPDIYQLLLSTLRVSAADCVAFEDSANGLASAKAAGLCAVVTPSRWTRGQDFGGADLVLRKFGDPNDQLDDRDAALIGGAPYLGLTQIRALHDKALRSRHQAGAAGDAPIRRQSDGNGRRAHDA
jgi:beta-phosphoglucomutase-like phosphatase (HAD superfamily)